MAWLLPAVLATALLAPLAQRLLADRAGVLLSVIPALVTLHAAIAQTKIAAGEIAASRVPWIPSLGIDWAFRVDGLANLFVLLVAGIGTLIVLYASGYLRGHPRLGRFYAFLFVFMAAMLGVATSDDLFLLFVFWELTTVSSYLLIGFESNRPEARRAALQSLLPTAAGGLALLAGFVLLASAADTTSLSELVTQGERVRKHPHYPWILSLVALGAFTKSAQFPFHFWLPAAMQAPTPVSAYLHSSTMVKAGVFLLARLSPVLGGSALWLGLLGGVGAATMLTGALLALGQQDLKRILAYSTVSVLGLLTMLLGLGTAIAARAFAVTLLAHALYKGTLFLVAGSVDHATGTRSLTHLGGLRRAMPWTAAAALVAGVSMAGAPPLFGFLAKETAYEAALEAPRWSVFFGSAVLVTGICLVFAALRVGVQAFAGTRPEGARSARDPEFAMWLGPTLLATAGLLAGLLVGPAEQRIIAPAADAILQERAPTGLALWHGFTPILALSAVTIFAGAALFFQRARVLSLASSSAGLARLGPARMGRDAWKALLAAASWQTRLLQNGSLHRYLAVTLTTAIAAALWGLLEAGLLAGLRDATGPFDFSEFSGITPIGAAAVLLVAGGSISMWRATSRLAAVVSLGAVGFGVALLFLVYSGPDLALTQLVVEVLSVVLFVLILRRLPGAGAARDVRIRPLAATIAAFGAATMAALTLVASSARFEEPISSFFDEQSVALAHGRNVVNVILVDFRALDTLGEITVLAVAALGILALLALRREAVTGGRQ